MVNITRVDLLRLATSFQYAQELEAIANASIGHVSFLSYDDSFVSQVLGLNLSQELVAHEDWWAFHEAGVFSLTSGKLYLTSNWNGTLANPENITAIDISHGNEVTSQRLPNITEPDGGCAYYPPGTPLNSSQGQQVVFADPGDFNNPPRVILYEPDTNQTRVLVDNFQGRRFNGPNDIKQHSVTGDLWFTDGAYSYWSGFNIPPTLPQQAYRFEPETGVIQAVADGFVAINGIELSPDLKHVYITDTGLQTFNPGPMMPTNPATVYRFDITKDGKRLENRSLFAYQDRGSPDGIHTDTLGNVYTANVDGIHVFNPSGVLIGKFAVGGDGTNNFAFAPGAIYIFNWTNLFKVNIKAEGRTVRRDFGLCE